MQVAVDIALAILCATAYREPAPSSSEHLARLRLTTILFGVVTTSSRSRQVAVATQTEPKPWRGELPPAMRVSSSIRPVVC